MVFNAAYALALRALHARLLEANIILKVRSCNGPFWHPDLTGSDHVDDNVIDAAFVDDEAVVLIARTPRLLQRAIKILLDVLPETFRRCKLEINWAPGKTEGLLVLRGKHATEVRELSLW